jgi:hypothetical protein
MIPLRGDRAGCPRRATASARSRHPTPAPSGPGRLWSTTLPRASSRARGNRVGTRCRSQARSRRREQATETWEARRRQAPCFARGSGRPSWSANVALGWQAEVDCLPTTRHSASRPFWLLRGCSRLAPERGFGARREMPRLGGRTKDAMYASSSGGFPGVNGTLHLAPKNYLGGVAGGAGGVPFGTGEALALSRRTSAASTQDRMLSPEGHLAPRLSSPLLIQNPAPGPRG